MTEKLIYAVILYLTNKTAVVPCAKFFTHYKVYLLAAIAAYERFLRSARSFPFFKIHFESFFQSSTSSFTIFLAQNMNSGQGWPNI